VKLGDLNVSKIAKKGLLYTQTGTPYYASPEVWRDKPYGAKSDIWSLGCVLYEATALHPPFRAKDMKGLYQKVISGHYPDIPKSYSYDLSNVIKMLLQQDPSTRPSCGNCKNVMVEEILRIPEVVSHMENQTALNDINNSLAKGEILGTIKLPKNLTVLSTRLPKPNYNASKDNLIQEQSVLKAPNMQKRLKCKDLTTIDEISKQHANNPLGIYKPVERARPRLPYKIRAKFLLPYKEL